MVNIIATLRCGLEVTQDHLEWYHSKAWIPISLVSYSHSIVTMAVSLAISEIFNVKE